MTTLSQLKTLCSSYSLSFAVLTEFSLKVPAPTQVLFVQNFTTAQRTALLLSPSTLALLYTPKNEHFGIGPVEAMACGLPVLAANSGGPIETVVDLDSTEGKAGGGTGLLRTPNGAEWGEALARLVTMGPSERRKIGETGRKRVEERFDLVGMGGRLEVVCRKAEAMGAVGLDGGRLVLALGVMGAVSSIGVWALRKVVGI